jgi:GntR family transcriptional regulator
VVSPHSDVPLYQQVAAALRARITGGSLAPGEELRAEPDLAHDYNVGRKTIRDALAVLRAEGLVVTRRGYRARVAPKPERQRVRIPQGAEVTARMPTPAERERWGLPVGVPVLVVGGNVYPADRFSLISDPG